MLGGLFSKNWDEKREKKVGGTQGATLGGTEGGVQEVRVSGVGGECGGGKSNVMKTCMGGEAE